MLPDSAEATRTRESSHLLPEVASPTDKLVIPLALPEKQDTDEGWSALLVGSKPDEERWKTVTVKRGDTLAGIFAREGISAQELHNILDLGEETRTLTRLYPGEVLKLRIDDGGQLQEIVYDFDASRTLHIQRDVDAFRAKLVQHPVERRLGHASATIESSLFGAAHEAGLSDTQALELAKIFGWDIDFALDIRRGDRFTVIYEELYVEGAKVADGPILGAEFINQGKTYRAVRYVDAQGKADYYTPDGQGMRKAFLRTPVEFSRITSGFNLQRRHPILNQIRAHKGVDYAAPSGTPVKATGDGKVLFKGTKGGYGKTIILQHGSRYTTLYAHLKGYARNLAVGNRVRQGEVIGYVGMTGLATGPHLHYEFRIDEKHHNPLTVALINAEPIAPEYRADFEKISNPLITQLQVLSRTAVALGTVMPNDL